MSLSGSSDSRWRSWATIRFAIWSSTGVPRKMMRSFRRLLASGGPQFCLSGALLLLGRPELLSRGSELEGNPLDVGDHAVERLAHAQIFAEDLVPAAGEDLLDDLVGLVALGLGVLADELSELIVADLDPGLVGDRLERELARDRERSLRLEPLFELLRRLVRDSEVGLGRDSAPLERADEARQELRCARLDERPGGLDVG